MTSQNHAILTLPLLLAEDVRANTFVDLTGRTAQLGAYAYGVATFNATLQGVPGVRDTVSVHVLGTAQVLADGQVEVGAQVIVGDGGRAMDINASERGGKVVGRALQAGGDGDLIEVLLIPN